MRLSEWHWSRCRVYGNCTAMTRFLVCAAVWLALLVPAQAALSIDGTVIDAVGNIAGGTTDTVSVVCAHAQDLVVVIVAVEVLATPHATVSSVISTGLTFTKRSSVYLDSVAGPFGTSWNSLETWSATATTAATHSITATISKAADTGTMAAICVNFDGVSFPVWSSNGSLPHTGTATGTSTPSIASNSTNAASIMFGFVMNAGFTANSAGSGYAIINQAQLGNGSLAVALANQDQSFALAQSGITVPFGTSWQTWSMIADAIEVPGGAPAAPPTRSLIGVGR